MVSHLTPLCLLLALHTVAAERTEVDLDHNGLIEINDLQDLDEIRNNPAADAPRELRGTHLYGHNGGCPDEGCRGYELTTDLDFDSNGNQSFDAGDLFWNQGLGFEPLGNFQTKFAAEFDGQGHTLSNLTMRRPGEYFTALFGYLEMASIHHLQLSADIEGGGNSGALAGYAWRSRFEDIRGESRVINSASTDPGCGAFCDANGNGGLIGSGDAIELRRILLRTEVSGEWESGGLAGYLSDSEIEDCGVQATVSGSVMSGGLVGRMLLADPAADSRIHSSFVAASVRGDNRIGALVGVLTASDVSDVLVSGEVELADIERVRAGGISGAMTNASLTHVIASVRLPADSATDRYLGAVSGEAFATDVSQTFVASDLAARTLAVAYGNTLPAQTYTLSHLQCASATSACDGLQFSGFETALNSSGQTLWQFGGQSDMPGMRLTQASLRDADGDGSTDQWPALSDPVEPPPAKHHSSGGDSTGLLLLLAVVWGLRRRRC